MNNILVTSVSMKVPLIESLIVARDKFDKNIKIIGVDMNTNIIASHFVDEFCLIKELKYLNKVQIIEFCKEKDIKYVIPTRDDDVLFFSKIKKDLEELSIFSFCPNISTVKLCYDKLEFSKLRNTIPTYLSVDECHGKRFVLKQRYGAGSLTLFLDISKEELVNKIGNLKNPIIQEFIKGQEYSIDSYVAKNGLLQASIIRSRDLIINGEAKITTRVFDEKLQEIIKVFLEKNKILGHSVIQVIKKKNKYHIIECNTRFGGASTLSYKLGLESFYWFLQECNNQDIELNISPKILKQVRVAKDIYFES